MKTWILLLTWVGTSALAKVEITSNMASAHLYSLAQIEILCQNQNRTQLSLRSKLVEVLGGEEKSIQWSDESQFTANFLEKPLSLASDTPLTQLKFDWPLSIAAANSAYRKTGKIEIARPFLFDQAALQLKLSHPQIVLTLNEQSQKFSHLLASEPSSSQIKFQFRDVVLSWRDPRSPETTASNTAVVNCVWTLDFQKD